MSQEPNSEPREFSIELLTGIGLFVFVLALYLIVSLDQWFFYWTSP